MCGGVLGAGCRGWVGLAVEKMCRWRSHMVSLASTVQEQEAEFTDPVGAKKSHHGNRLLFKLFSLLSFSSPMFNYQLRVRRFQ